MNQPAAPRKWDSWIPVLDGSKKGVLPTLQRCLLWPASFIYRTIVGVRNRRFGRPSAITHASVPVISVGNLTTGGTGKTPMVEWICGQLRAQHLRVALISRGYGGVEGRANDEALELELSLPDVPHLQDPDRCKMAAIATEELASQCIVMDDGFQHRKLHRDLDIVLIDATNPFGFGYCLPRGLLREPISSLKRADAVVITRVDLVTADRLEKITRQVGKHLRTDVPIATCLHRAKQLVNSQGKIIDVDQLKGKSVFAIAGIGNPNAFLRSVDTLGSSIVEQKMFPDHHSYQRSDIDQTKEVATRLKQTHPGSWIVTTRKDLVKLNIQAIAGIPIWALQIEIDFLSGEDKLVNLLETCIQACPADEW